MNATIRHIMNAIPAAIGALALIMLVYAALMEKIPLSDRSASPGFGWGWDFDKERALREPFLTLGSPLNQPPSKSAAEPLILPLNQPVAVAGLQITYRGINDAGRILLDTVILELDPDYAYPRVLGLSEARKGFTLFDQHFELKNAGPYVLRLQHSGSDD